MRSELVRPEGSRPGAANWLNRPVNWLIEIIRLDVCSSGKDVERSWFTCDLKQFSNTVVVLCCEECSSIRWMYMYVYDVYD